MRARPILHLLLSLAILAILYSVVPVSDVAGALAGARAGPLALALLALAAQHALIALRQRILTDVQGFRISAFGLLQIHLATAFYRLFLPGGTVASIAVRFYKLQRVERGRAGAFAAVVFDRFLATLGLAIVGATCWAIDRPPLPPAVGGTFLLALVAVGLLSATLVSDASHRLGRRLVAAVPVPALAAPLGRALEAVSALRRIPPARRPALAALCLLPHALGVLVFWLLAVSLDVAIGPATSGWARAALILLAMLPITVAGLGVRDAGLLYLLQPLGVPGEQALALAALVFAVNVLAVAAVGGLVEAAALLRPAPVPPGPARQTRAVPRAPARREPSDARH